jgi:RsmE family RNA methyltransferase
LNLILLEAAELSADGSVQLSGPRAAHLLNVLRVAAGQSVRVGVLDGPRGVGTVESTGADAVELSCVLEADGPTRPRVDLLLAVPRPKVLRRLWAQLAALGVARIILTNAERVERPYFDTHVLTPECYRPLLIEGLQQARDTRLPTVSIHRQFKVLVEDELDTLSDASFRLVADPGASASAGAVVRGGVQRRGDSRVLLAIGPEGGWNAFELRLLDAHGFERAGMGPRTLRTDTACLALLALVHDALCAAA